VLNATFRPLIIDFQKDKMIDLLISKTKGMISFGFCSLFLFLMSTAQASDLSPNATIELQEVVVTSTRTERLAHEVPQKTDILDASNLALTSKFNLGEALELVNGARTENNCQNCGTAEIQLLGLPGNYNQILIDKQPLFTGLASIYGIDQVPTIFVDQVEIVKGGASALYGPGAVSGVINIIPAEPYESHSKFSLDYRRFGGSSAKEGQFSTSWVSREHPWLKTTLYGTLGEQNPTDLNGDSFTEITSRDYHTLGLYAWAAPTDNSFFKFNYQMIQEERRGGDRLHRPPHLSQSAEDLNTNYHWASCAWEQRINNIWNFSLTASTVMIDRDSYYGGTAEQLVDPGLIAIDSQNPSTGTYNGRAVDHQNINSDGEFSGTANSDEAKAFSLFGDGTGQGGGSTNQYGFTDSSTTILDSQFNADLGTDSGPSHLITFGVQYQKEDLLDENRNAFGFTNSVLHDDTFSNLGFYLQDQWQTSDKLEFIPGLRFDKANTLDDLVVSPRLATRYTLNRDWNLRASFSTGFLAPRVFNEDLHVDSLGGQPIDIVNADNLKEERSTTGTLGFNFRPSALEGKFITAFQAYWTELKDSFATRALSRSGPRGVDERFNSSGASVLGLEWDFSIDMPSFWTCDGGLAWVRSRYDEAQEITGGAAPILSDRFNKTPDWTGLLQLSYIDSGLVDGFISMKWTGPMKVGQSSPSDKVFDSESFYVVSAGLNRSFDKRWGKMIAKIGVNNIFDEFQEDLQLGPTRDSEYVYGPRRPRTFFIGFEGQF
jgi:outer membrane receptor for ferrienterochelin and colicins